MEFERLQHAHENGDVSAWYECFFYCTENGLAFPDWALENLRKAKNLLFEAGRGKGKKTHEAEWDRQDWNQMIYNRVTNLVCQGIVDTGNPLSLHEAITKVAEWVMEKESAGCKIPSGLERGDGTDRFNIVEDAFRAHKEMTKRT